ncbi:ABC1 kinase family protein [[Mycobacterium] nativiensis]|uniref:AarF/ABC1/UbiB kinase family protein n=1 Tax=[Mycobacterium] nativiensis TaxID=2855503 RepID=A0ABU5XVN7_9MYCO|nr:AarF/ABC1/UbiB kinase family protein [Mycolicibacter sp. MYC340]MEB3031978.1 AarF/ABC1/UbiB kinase family protein [Mycolicibacter sp. MYC340]
MSDAPLPTSRVSRGAALGRLAAKQTLRRVVIKAGSVGLSESRRATMLDAADQRMARDFVAVLGDMRGAAMKMGQLLSFIDLGIVDERSRTAFSAQLSRLQGSADALPFEMLRPVIETELGPVGQVFASFETNAFAAASIGQVYRAVTHDGRQVAVKVQYPGVRSAVRADLKNLALFLRMWKSRVPAVAARDFLDEITGELSRELDYRQEFANQARVAQRFADHPFIHVPAPVAELSSDSVLTTEYVDGLTAQQVAELPAADRDRVGEIVYRFYLGSLFSDCEFNGDAHPGNFLYLPDRRVAFLDFGLYKRMAPEAVDMERRAAQLCIEADGDGLRALLEQAGVLRHDSNVTAADCLQYTLDAAGWNFVDDYVRIEPAEVSAAMLGAVYPGARPFESMRNERLPPEHLFSRRLDFLVFGTISHIGAGGNWYRIAAEWIHGAPPVTDLGVAEAAWRAARG